MISQELRSYNYIVFERYDYMGNLRVGLGSKPWEDIHITTITIEALQEDKGTSSYSLATQLPSRLFELR